MSLSTSSSAENSHLTSVEITSPTFSSSIHDETRLACHVFDLKECYSSPVFIFIDMYLHSFVYAVQARFNIYIFDLKECIHVHPFYIHTSIPYISVNIS
jgi:hypothetical protein